MGGIICTLWTITQRSSKLKQSVCCSLFQHRQKTIGNALTTVPSHWKTNTKWGHSTAASLGHASLALLSYYYLFYLFNRKPINIWASGYYMVVAGVTVDLKEPLLGPGILRCSIIVLVVREVKQGGATVRRLVRCPSLPAFRFRSNRERVVPERREGLNNCANRISVKPACFSLWCTTPSILSKTVVTDNVFNVIND